MASLYTAVMGDAISVVETLAAYTAVICEAAAAARMRCILPVNASL